LTHNFHNAEAYNIKQKTIDFYSTNSLSFFEQYQSITTADVFGSAINLFPVKPSFILDIGSGSGRDAAWMAQQGHIVTAVEPAANMRKQAAVLHRQQPIQWIDDRLPELSSINRPQSGFDFILISAVWMHLTPDDRLIALQRLASLISDEGTILISLRHGPSDPSRPMLPINTTKEIENAKNTGFKTAETVPTSEQDKLGRQNVYWEMLKLKIQGHRTT
jgi:2-polyprenyl-3-methyl-5-hydroxy-6-metoxy-1,4-benzoquinol methylase